MSQLKGTDLCCQTCGQDFFTFQPNNIEKVNVLKFCTPTCLIKLHIKTVQTQIRLLLKEQSVQGLHCLSFHQAFCGINAFKKKTRAVVGQRSSPAGYILYCNIFIIKPYNIGHTDLDVFVCKSFCHIDIIIQVRQFSMK